VDRDVLVVARSTSRLVEVGSEKLGIVRIYAARDAVTAPKFVWRGVCIDYRFETRRVIVLDDSRSIRAVRELKVERFGITLCLLESVAR